LQHLVNEPCKVECIDRSNNAIVTQMINSLVASQHTETISR
jgi:hypothetical protein